MKATKRNMIKQLLNRESTYRVSDFVRKITKATYKIVTRSDILCCLSHLQTEGKLVYCLSGNFVIGTTV